MTEPADLPTDLPSFNLTQLARLQGNFASTGPPCYKGTAVSEATTLPNAALSINSSTSGTSLPDSGKPRLHSQLYSSF